MHVNADILKRLVDRGGEQLLVQILEAEAKRANDLVSEWVKDHLEDLMGEVEGLVFQAEELVGRWW